MPKSKRKHIKQEPHKVADIATLQKIQTIVNVAILKSLLGIKPLTHNERKRALRRAKSARHTDNAERVI